VAASQLDDSQTVDVGYSIVTDSSQDRSVTEYFSIDASTGILSTKASLAQFGTLLTRIPRAILIW